MRGKFFKSAFCLALGLGFLFSGSLNVKAETVVFGIQNCGSGTVDVYVGESVYLTAEASSEEAKNNFNWGAIVGQDTTINVIPGNSNNVVKIEGLKVGNGSITAGYQDATSSGTRTCMINVIPKTEREVSIQNCPNGSIYLNVGRTVSLNSFHDGDNYNTWSVNGTSKNIGIVDKSSYFPLFTEPNIIDKINKTSIELKALEVGEQSITLNYEDRSSVGSATCLVKVIPADVHPGDITNCESGQVELYVGDNIDLIWKVGLGSGSSYRTDLDGDTDSVKIDYGHEVKNNLAGNIKLKATVQAKSAGTSYLNLGLYDGNNIGKVDSCKIVVKAKQTADPTPSPSPSPSPNPTPTPTPTDGDKNEGTTGDQKDDTTQTTPQITADTIKTNNEKANKFASELGKYLSSSSNTTLKLNVEYKDGVLLVKNPEDKDIYTTFKYDEKTGILTYVKHKDFGNQEKNFEADQFDTIVISLILDNQMSMQKLSNSVITLNDLTKATVEKNGYIGKTVEKKYELEIEKEKYTVSVVMIDEFSIDLTNGIKNISKKTDDNQDLICDILDTKKVDGKEMDKVSDLIILDKISSKTPTTPENPKTGLYIGTGIFVLVVGISSVLYYVVRKQNKFPQV